MRRAVHRHGPAVAERQLNHRVAAHQRQGAGQEIPVRKVVRLGDPDELALRQLRRLAPLREDRTGVDQVRDVADLAVPFGGNLRDDLGAVVRGAVVQHQHFAHRVGLVEDAAQPFRHVAGVIVVRHRHRNRGQVRNGQVHQPLHVGLEGEALHHQPMPRLALPGRDAGVHRLGNRLRHGGDVAIGHHHAFAHLAQHVRNAAGPVEGEDGNADAERFQRHRGERVLARGQRVAVRRREHRIHVVAVARHAEGAAGRRILDLGCQPVLQAGVDAARPGEMDAARRRHRRHQAPQLQEQVEALAQVGIADADDQAVALGHAELGAHPGAGLGAEGDILVDALRQDQQPVARLGLQLAQQLVAHEGGREHRVARRLHRHAGTRGQVLLADDARQFVHQHDRLDPCRPGAVDDARGGGGVDDGMAEALLRQRLQPVVHGGLVRRHGQWRHRLVGRLHLAAVQQQELHLQAKAAARHAAEVQQQLLRAAGEGVVAHQQQPRRAHRTRQPADRAPRGVQVGGAVVQVGLQVGALAPFVPRVDADERLAEERLVARGPDQLRQPGLVLRRGGAHDRQAGALPPGVVVPARHRRPDQREVRRRLGERDVDHVVVVVDAAAEVGVQVVQRRMDGLHVPGQLVRRELDAAIQAVRRRVVVVEGLRHHHDGVFVELGAEDVAPALDGLLRIRDQAGAVDHQQRPALDPDVAAVGEVLGELGGHLGIVVRPVVLRDQHLALGAVPAPGPVLVRPHQGEGHVDGLVVEEAPDRLFHQPPAVEPVVVEHETMHAAGLGHLDLVAERLVAVQPVEAEVARHPRLVVPLEARHPAHEVGPFGEAGAPPAVILAEGVELRQVIGQQLDLPDRRGRQRQRFLILGRRLGIALDLARYRGLVIGHAAVHAGLALVQHVVLERIVAQVAAQVALGIEPDIEFGRGVAPLPVAEIIEVQERVHPRRRHVRVVPAIILGVEVGKRTDRA